MSARTGGDNRNNEEGTWEEHLESARSVTVQREAHLFLLLQCDHPGRSSWRCRLAGIDKVQLGRGETTGAQIERAGHRRHIVLSIADRQVSSRHAEMTRSDDSFFLSDAGSRNGTFVNGSPVAGGVLLQDGDFIWVGHTLLRFRTALRTASDAEVLQSLGIDQGEPGLGTLLPSLALSFRKLLRIAADDIAVLIRGETGTGKELVAQAIHRRSPRRERPLVSVNCAAFSDSLLQSELFGHEKGSFTGATTDKIGLVRSAAGGTLFLDEVGDMPLSAQVALLRTLQSKTVRPLGATRDIPIDFRLLCATHCDLRGMIAKEQFRSDLYARLNAFEIVLPPLRKRREDLGIIISRILQKRGKPIALSKEAAAILFLDEWPLNIRELEQCLASACVLAGDGPIEPVHLGGRAPKDDASTAPDAAPAEIPSQNSLSEPERDLEERLVEQLKEAEGNVAEVGRKLGKKPPQIFRWLKRLGIDPDRFRPKPRRGA